MTEVFSRRLASRAEQFTGTADNIRALSAAFPGITAQEASAGIEGRLYLPTINGTAVVPVGWWIVETRIDGVRVIDAYPEEVFRVLYEPDTENQLDLGGDESAPAPVITVTPLFVRSDYAPLHDAELENAITTAGLDWTVVVDHGYRQLMTVGTGAKLGEWDIGDTVRIEFDGTVEAIDP